MQKTIKFGIVLISLAFFLIIVGLTVQAADIKKDDTNKILYIASGSYNLSTMLAHANVTTAHLWQAGTVWQANYSIQINASATLRLNPTDNCTWLKLNSLNASGKENVYIRVIGHLFVNDTMITGWESGANDTTYSAFRPYIYICPATDTDPTHAIFLNSKIGYLGFNKDNKYGIVYEDIANKDPIGYMRNCDVLENYIGICFQGVLNMNVTDSDFNNTISAGIVYTTGSVTAQGSDNGYVGVQSLTGTTIRDSDDGMRVISDNISCDNLRIYDCSDDGLCVSLSDNITITNSDFYNNGGEGVYFFQVTNSMITAGTVAYSNDHGLYLDESSFNDISVMHNRLNIYDDFYLLNSFNNTFTSCQPHDSDIGFELEDSNNNTLTNCISYNHSWDGFLLNGGYENLFESCYVYDSDVGFDIYGDANNNTIINSTFSNNSWGIWMWADALDNCINNMFIYCTINDNTNSGIDIGRAPVNYFYESDILNNTAYGVEVDSSATAVFFNCIVDNPSPTQYDWFLDDTTTVAIFTPYILGFNREINYQFDTVQPYGAIVHIPGMGDYNLNTTMMTIYCQPDNESYVNLTVWTSSPEKVQWKVNASSGTMLYQKIGGLTPNTRYDLKVGSSIQSSNYSVATTMLPTHGIVYCVNFNYSGSWSTKTFTIERHSPVSPAGAVPSGIQSVGAGNELPSESAFLGLNWIYWLFIIIIIVTLISLFILLLPKKKRKR